jgi:hypothetical protein
MAKHPSAKFIAMPADPKNGFPNALIGDPEGDEFEDTDATFLTDVLSLYPAIPPYPDASYYGVGYGALVACDELMEQLAWWDSSEKIWKED